MRVHCAHALRNAIIGDYTYTGDSETERMYLHAHRIVIPNGVEDLDVEGREEPFCNLREYKTISTVRSLSEAYQVLEDRPAAKDEWKLITKSNVVLC